MSKGSYSLVFDRSCSPYTIPTDLGQLAKICQQQWNDLHPTNALTFGAADLHMYGEPTFGTMARICHTISSELANLGNPLNRDDILLDWGCGAGKWLCFARQFLSVPDMTALGIEVEEGIFAICKKNIAGRWRCNALHAQVKASALSVRLALFSTTMVETKPCS